MKKAIFPGSFDPFHEGHLSIFNKALELFDEVIIYVTDNNEKENQAPLKDRVNLIKEKLPDTKILFDKKLTALVAKENDAFYIIRGLRSYDEVEYEITLASINKYLNTKLETIIIFADEELKNISSTLLRKIEKEYSDDMKTLKDTK